METLLDNEIILDSELEIKPIPENRYDVNNVIKGLTGKDLKTVRTAINGDYAHQNFLSYVAMAWNHHYGVVISPDIIWYGILSEMAGHIKDNTEKYRDLFTTSKGKVEISIPTGDPQLIDLSIIMDRLRDLVPTDTDLFVPKFSTSTEQSMLAFNAAFADAVSQYYNYSMYLCGLSKIKILGTADDWIKIRLSINAIKEIIDLPEYFEGLLSIIDNFENPSADKMKDFFELVECGSGHQAEVEGWITKLFIKVPKVGYVSNFSNQVSVVKYKCLSTGISYELNHGLFSSVIEDDYLVPDFGYFINEVEPVHPADALIEAIAKFHTL